MKVLKSIPFHPVLWALFPPLALLGNNISQIPAGYAVRTLVVSVLLSLLVWLIFRLLLGSWHKAAVVASGFLILFFSYGHVYRLVEDASLFGINMGRHRFLVPIFLLVFLLIFIWSWRQKEPTSITGVLNIIGLVVLVLPLFQIVSYEVKTSTTLSGPSDEHLSSAGVDLSIAPGIKPPDIYYIILDTYTRADTLSTYFSYDNSSFLNDLKSRGFYIAGCSQSNYSFTSLSLASSLNYNYVTTLSSQFVSSNKDETDVHPFLSNNAVVYNLRKLGYRFVAFDSGYSPTEFTGADIYYAQQSDLLDIFLMDGINPFESLQLNTSAVLFIYESSPQLKLNVQKFLNLDSAYVVFRNRILYALNHLERAASIPGPKFVFVHILAPHNPFVFGAHGEYVQRKTPFTLNDDQEVVKFQDYLTGYDNQVTYLNQRILTIVDSLIQNSTQPPIIILQGDHGSPRLPGWDDTILNAYYLPEGGEAALYPNISPVNTFRVVFDQYFGAQLNLLPDNSCTTDAADDPFACTPVPDPNPTCAP